MVKSRGIRWTENAANVGEKGSIEDFRRKAERKEISSKTKMWKEDNKMELRESEWDYMDWIHLAQHGN